MKRYCLDCGAPTEYSLKKPVFCSNCGNSFEKSIKTSQIPVQKVQIQKPTIAKKTYIPEVDVEDEQDVDNEEEATNVPNISNIQIETTTEATNRGVKLKDLMGTGDAARRTKTKTRGKKPSKKQILEEFAKEAGSLRKNRK